MIGTTVEPTASTEDCLRGKACFVRFAVRSIGLAIARRFFAEDAKEVAMQRTPRAYGVREGWDRVPSLFGGACDPGALTLTVNQALERFSGVDVLCSKVRVDMLTSPNKPTHGKCEPDFDRNMEYIVPAARSCVPR